MDVRFYQSVERIINHSVPLNPVLAFERCGNDGYVEVTPAIPGAFVPGMQMTLVFDEKFRWMKGRFQFRANACDAVVRHGRTSLKGFTVTLA